MPTIPKKYQDIADKIKALPMDDMLNEHLTWIKKYRARKVRPQREDVKRRMLKIADDIRFWATQVAIEQKDVGSLLSLTEDIYNRYEDRPKIAGASMSEDDEIGGVIILPPIKEVHIVKKGKEDK